MTAAEIVARLARLNPIRPVTEERSTSVHWNRCLFCDGVAPYYDPPRKFPHEPGCLWLAAVEAVS